METDRGVDNKQERHKISAIINEYHQAFATMDMTLFKAVWDRDYDNIIYIVQERPEPLRRWTELEEYFSNVERTFKSVITMVINDLTINILNKVAYTYFTYHFEAEAKGNERIYR